MRGESRELIRRILIAVAVGLLVAGTAYWCAYRVTGGMHRQYQDAWRTRYELRVLRETVEQYRRTTGRLPATLTEIEGVKEACRLNADGQVVDYWGHPYQYRVEGESFTLVSYGRDGQPGGEDDNADIDLDHPAKPPTLYQFTFELPTGGIRWTCLLSGICAGLICLRPSRDRRGTGLLVRVGATTGGAILVAVVLSVLHIPTGH